MTSNDKALRRYCRQVSKYLVCKPQTKERLISGLQQELTDNDLAGSGNRIELRRSESRCRLLDGSCQR